VQAARDLLHERRARREREQLRQEPAHRVVDGDRPVAAADPDVDVQAEGVVSPHDVPQQLVVLTVVRRVDDSLVLPAAPRMRACRPEREAELRGDGLKLRAPLDHERGSLGEVGALAGADLCLRRDQLADEVRLDLRPHRSGLHLLEAVHERE
jgi:hypothetical protein